MSPAGVRVTRPKGFHPWKPHPPSLQLIENVQAILDEYSAHLPLTVRQIFYRLVGAYDYEKTEKAYKKLCERLVRARRAQLIPFGSIRDDGGSAFGAGGWDDIAEFWRSEQDSAAGYERDRMQGQPTRIELWCEAEGMAPQLARVAAPYGVGVYSTGGFSSITVTRRIAERALRADKPTAFLHVGDFDPSGQSIYEAMAADAGLFVEQLRRSRGAPGAYLDPVRVALTAEQVTEHDLPTAPPKDSDTRTRNWEGETCQAEAMAPDLLARIVKDAITSRIDHDIRDAVLKVEARERETAVRTVGAMLHAVDPVAYPIKYSGPMGGYFDPTDDDE